MGISDKINEILDEKSKVEEVKVISNIEIFMNWLFTNYEFRLNSLSLRPEFKEAGSNEFKELDDNNYNTISLFAEINGFSKSMVERLHKIIYSSYVAQANEIEDFFKNIEPLGKNAEVGSDGTFYMPTVKDYFDCLEINNRLDKDTLYNIFSRWIIACVNSALGVKHNDVMLILSGSQGIFKTSYLNNLVPDELNKYKYLVTGHIEPTLTNQNTANYLCEKFIINIDDQLEIIFGKEYNSMKAIISVDRVTSRRVYAKFDRTRKRISNFVGSVNSTDFLTDNQNRRYFIIEISSISTDYKNIDMCRFWAEAYKVAQKLNPYQVISSNIYKEINNISASFVQSSIEQTLLMRLFSPIKTDTYSEELFMTGGEILYELQKFTTKPLSHVKLGNELKRMNYEKTTKYFKELKYSKYGYILYTSLSNADEFKRYLIEEEKDLAF